MSKDQHFESALKELAELQNRLMLQDGTNANSQLFEQVLEIQGVILGRFGLPGSPVYEEILWFNNIPAAPELKKRVDRLRSAATTYLLSNAKSDLQTLREAQENKSNAMEVLPELKIPTHIYMLFVFNHILLEKKDTVENVLWALRHSNRPQILNALTRAHCNKKNADLSSPEFAGVKYLKEFLI